MLTSRRPVTRSTTAVAFGVVALTLGLAPPSSALAEGVVTRERIRVEFEDQVDEHLSDACGTTVTADARFNIHLLEFADGRSKIHINSWSQLSSPHGTVSTIGTSMIHFEPEQVIDNGDGTHTILMPHREAVSYVSLIDGAHMTDAGTIDWELSIIVDNDTGAVLNDHEVIIQTTGRFPTLDRGGQLAVLCEALTT